MTFLELFLICTFKDPKLAEKWTNLAENPIKKLNSAKFMDFIFPSLGGGSLANTKSLPPYNIDPKRPCWLDYWIFQ